MEPDECCLCGCTQSERFIGYPLVPNPATSQSSKDKGFEDVKSVEVKWWFSDWSYETLLTDLTSPTAHFTSLFHNYWTWAHPKSHI